MNSIFSFLMIHWRPYITMPKVQIQPLLQASLSFYVGVRVRFILEIIGWVLIE